MNRYAKVFLAVFLATAAGLASAVVIEGLQLGGTAKVFVDVFRPAGTTDSAALRTAPKGVVLYDSGLVAAGALITSPVLDVTGISTLYAVVVNSDGAASRAFSLKSYLDDGTSLVDTPYAPTVGTATTARYAIGNGVINTGLTGAISIPLPTKIVVSLAAGGSSNGRITIFGR